jgi:tetraacyldisaccharide 4'-kinase
VPNADTCIKKPPLPGILGKALSRIYLAELGRRSRRFDRGIGVDRLDLPVISIGNLSVGGTGKTPMVRQVCQWLIDAGHKPCIAMRGYKAGAEGSDEQREYRDTLPDVPIVAQPDRAVGVRTLMNTPEGTNIDTIVLDDGFQHRQLARDLDIVLLDATRDPFMDRALPAGWLRELPGALARAHAVVVTHAELVDESAVESMIASARAVNPDLICAAAAHEWAGFVVVADNEPDRIEPTDWLTGRAVVAACAIGNPGAFLAAAREAIGSPPAAEVVLRDHDRYAPAAIDRIAAEVRRTSAKAILTTGKDLVKLRQHADSLAVPIAAARLQLSLARAENELRHAVLAAAARDRIG